MKLHVSTALEDASRNGVNFLLAIQGAAERLDDDELRQIYAEILPLYRRVNRKMEAAKARLRTYVMVDPDGAEPYLNGDKPWPDDAR